MGRVYEAEHASLARPCALKVMNPGLVAREPQVVYRFWAEARAIAGLVHPHIVTVHNLGHERGYHYIEMEYVPGGVTLKERLVREGPLDPLQATTLVRQVALALGAAHASGLVHRDVKPANVLLSTDDRAKLADFGLVRRVSDRDGGTANLAGTPTFMAPELFAGAAASPRSDLYALGVMYFYLLTTRMPYASEEIGHLIRLHRRAPIPDIRKLAPQVPERVGEIVTRLMAKEATDRYGSAEDLADDLKLVVGELRATGDLIAESIAGLDCLVQQGDYERYRVIFRVPGDRIQEVYIEVVEGRKKERLLTVYSVCAPADPRHYEYALKLNAELTHGSLSMREVNGRPMFVMSRTFSRGHVSPPEVRAAVLEIARRGDRVEQQLTSTDLF
jgi:serine/threonine-protein kinase